MDIQHLQETCGKLYERSAGEAGIQPLEPNLEIVLRATDRLGHVSMQVQITPDHMTQDHQFTFDIDQSYLPDVIRQCDEILQQFPARS